MEFIPTYLIVCSSLSEKKGLNLKDVEKSLNSKCLTRTNKKKIILHELYTYNISNKGI